MKELPEITELLIQLLPILGILMIWEMVWKLIALWKAGRNNELVWFICIAVFNTVGILPIIYLYLVKKRKNSQEQFVDTTQ